MENRVRDLEQMEERDPEDRGRRIGMVVMATLGIVGLTFAMGVVVGKAAEVETPAKDPLDQLDRVAAVSAKATKGSAGPKAAEGIAPVEAADLSFPKTLTEDEDRPEVIAALEAAAREEATLDAAPAASAEKAAPSAEPAEAAPQPSAAAAEPAAPGQRALIRVTEGSGEVDEAAEQPAEERVQAALPAAVAAGSAGRKLARAAQHDALVDAALPAGPNKHAAHGEAGAFTLQVISYDAPAPAQAFASGLRAKGHEAFVTQADVPERGRYYRVRIGPFATRERADAYRHKFEADEHMNTIVVKREKADSDR